MARLVVTRMLRFGDCDPSGVAYFPSYLDILCGVTEEFWQRIGHSWSDMLAGRLEYAPRFITAGVNFNGKAYS